MTNPSDLGLDSNATPRREARTPHRRGAVLKAVPALAPEEVTDEGAGPADATAPEGRQTIDAVLAAARPRMYAVALRLTKNHHEAEDVVQEAMLKAWRNMGRFEGRAAFATWVHRIVVNTALDRLRARRPEVTLAGGAAGSSESDGAGPHGVEATSPETPEDLVRGAEIGAAVHRALGALSPVHRDALALRELEGESYQSIARLVRCPIGTVMSRLHHARHRLAEEIATQHRELHPRAA